MSPFLLRTLFLLCLVVCPALASAADSLTPAAAYTHTRTGDVATVAHGGTTTAYSYGEPGQVVASEGQS